MKKALLFLTFLPFGNFAQTFDQSNEASIGTLVTLHLCDSFATDYANIIGNNVTWDYSQLAGIYGMTKDVEIQDASADPNFASFTGATNILSIGGTLQTFTNSNTTNRISQGFVFNEVSLGSVVASWNIDQQTVMNYPFTLGNSVADNYSGTITSTATGVVSATGTSLAVFDGTGTLLLPGGNTYSSVARYHLKDSASAVVFGNQVSFVRNIYEYYDFSLSNMPIFMKVNVSVNSPFFNNATSMVLSKDLPTTFVGLYEDNATTIGLYPNPSSDELCITGLTQSESYVLFNQQGKILIQGIYTGTLDISELNSGIYFVKINNRTYPFVKK